MPNSFTLFAASVTNAVHELLENPVLVTDKSNIVIASSPGSWEGLQVEAIVPLAGITPIQIPLCLDSEVGKLNIYQSEHDENKVALTRKVVRLAIDQILLIEQLPNYHLLKDNFLYNLLHGRIHDTAIIELHAQKLNLDLAPPRSAIVVDASHFVMSSEGENPNLTETMQYRRRIDSVINCIVDFFSLPNDTICASMGQGKIAILKATNTKNLANWAGNEPVSSAASWANLTALKRASQVLLTVLSETLQDLFTIGIGRHHPGITGLTHSYQDALAALSLGLRFYGANAVHCLDELGIAAFAGISDERIKSELASHILSPLSYEPRLLETLHAFFDSNCTPSQAATELEIHRNSLTYRLDKITALTGLDPRQFDDAVQLRLALLLRAPS